VYRPKSALCQVHLKQRIKYTETIEHQGLEALTGVPVQKAKRYSLKLKKKQCDQLEQREQLKTIQWTIRTMRTIDNNSMNNKNNENNWKQFTVAAS